MALPSTLRAGDTWVITHDDAAYPPSAGWAATLYVKAAAGSFSASATGAGSTYTVTYAAASSAAVTPGTYDTALVASKAGEVVTLATARLTVLPNLGAAGQLDVRTHATRVLAAIEAVIEGRASIDQESVEIAGRALKRTPLPDLLALRSRYQIEARREAAAANGVDGRRYFVRFG